MSVKPTPEGYHSVTPYLIVRGGADAIEFYKKAFGAVELFRFPSPDGKIGHAEIKVGDSPIMLADEFPDMGFLSPETIGGSPVSLYVYVEDVDKFTGKAVAEGLTVVKPVADQFYGDRSGSFKDPFGHTWGFATHIEDLTPEEVNERAAAAHGSA